MLGQSDVPLTVLGLEQARRIADALSSQPIAHVYSSPLHRARDTAVVIARRSEARLEVETIDDLQELNVGSARGITWAQIEDRWPSFARDYTAGDEGIAVHWPAGESGQELCQRVKRALDAIVGRHLVRAEGGRSDETLPIVIVAHGGALAWAFQHLLRRPLTTRPRFGIPNASISEFRVRSLDEPAELLRLNDVSHLGDSTNDLSPYRGRF